MKPGEELPLSPAPWQSTLRLRCLELAAELRAASTTPAQLVAVADELLAYVLGPFVASDAPPMPALRPGAAPVPASSSDTSAAPSAAEPDRSPESRAAQAGDTARNGPAKPGTRSERRQT